MLIGQFIHQALLHLHSYLTLPGTQRGDVIALIAQMRKLTAENWCDLPRATTLLQKFPAEPENSPGVFADSCLKTYLHWFLKGTILSLAKDQRVWLASA